MTQAQINQQHHQQLQANLNAKIRSRKPTDKNLPDGVEESLAADSDVAVCYRELRDLERRLDATMTRKRLDIVDSLNRSAKVCFPSSNSGAGDGVGWLTCWNLRKQQRYKTLRIWITNTVEDQFWQNNGLNVDSFDFSSNLESSYRVKIEGRLLDDEESGETDEEGEQRKAGDGSGEADADKMETDSPTKTKTKPAPTTPRRPRMSHFFKAITVDFDRTKLGRPANEMPVEWKKPERTSSGGAGANSNLAAAADFDEFTFKRNGDENVNITINLFRHEDPERFELAPALAEVVDMREGTRNEVAMALWEYIKLMNLQEDEEKRNFRCDDLLRKVCPFCFPSCLPSHSACLLD